MLKCSLDSFVKPQVNDLDSTHFYIHRHMHNFFKSVVSLHYQRGNFLRSTIGLVYFFINVIFTVFEKAKCLITICQNFLHEVKVGILFYFVRCEKPVNMLEETLFCTG